MELLFERSRAGRGMDLLPGCDVPEAEFAEGLLRQEAPKLPELAVIDLGRLYTELAKETHGVNDGFYPLGSCTMKYNPRINEEMSSLPGFTAIHPLQPENSVQGALQVMYETEKLLGEITGMDSITDGGVDLEALQAAVGDDTAGLMLTNPNTVGIFDPNILEITSIIHEAGGLCYYDGANLNAIMGVVRPGDMGFDCVHVNLHKTFSTPHGGGRFPANASGQAVRWGVFPFCASQFYGAGAQLWRQFPGGGSCPCLYPDSWQGRYSRGIYQCGAECQLHDEPFERQI